MVSVTVVRASSAGASTRTRLHVFWTMTYSIGIYAAGRSHGLKACARRETRRECQRASNLDQRTCAQDRPEFGGSFERPKAVTLVADLDDVAAMRQPVEERRRYLGVADDAAPSPNDRFVMRISETRSWSLLMVLHSIVRRRSTGAGSLIR